MNITLVLSEEHQNILTVIDGVLKECTEIERGKDIDKGYFAEVIDFIKNYADGYHHAKEEDILFKAMLENVENLHCNPIPVMLHEHDEGRQYIKNLEEGIANSDKEQILTNAKGYCFLLQNHIYKEDNVLYPMAEEALSEAQKELIQAKYKQVKDELFSARDIQKYIDLVSAK
jgi:hemerythrin-like domain-containing protein